MLISNLVIGQQDFSIEYKDTIIYEIQDLGEGSLHVLYNNIFEEIEFSRGITKATKVTQDLIWLDNEVNWAITFYDDSLIQIDHHMTDGKKHYCDPCNGFKKE